jgi:hypothetical protein
MAAAHEHGPTTHGHRGAHGHHEMHRGAYLRLAVMAGLSFVAMYVLMYAMVDKFEDVYPNLNQVWMAGLMTAPMIVFELALMSAMYRNRSANLVILAVSIIAGVFFWTAIRQQTAIDDTQFLQSMIPHHSGAILMCREAPITDARIADLCDEIIAGQQEEIERMRGILGER